MEYLHAIGTFIFGILLGYLFQRARMCFIGGMRDFYLIRDTWLIKGLFGFFGGALLGYIIFSAMSKIPFFPWIAVKGFTPIPGDPLGKAGSLVGHLIVAIIGGFGVGFFSVIQGGCPLRNYVMAAEGNKTAIAYILGLAVGAVLFHTVVVPIVKAILL